MGLTYEDCEIDVSIAVWHWGHTDSTAGKGSHAKVSSYVRHHINTNMSSQGVRKLLFKMARTEAERDGYDEAILLDANGHVAEGPWSTSSLSAMALW
jgi:branched-chain amino acid aminotransferase